MWPTFVAVTLLDGLILHLLPPVGTGVDLVPGILIATFGNLLLIAAIAPWLARRTWNRRPAAEAGAPPRAQLEVLSDRIGTGLLLATIVGVTAAGLAARPLVVAETDAKERAAETLYSHVRANGTPEQRRNLEASDMDRWFEGYFRACIPSDDRRSLDLLPDRRAQEAGDDQAGPERRAEPAPLDAAHAHELAAGPQLEQLQAVRAGA